MSSRMHLSPLLRLLCLAVLAMSSLAGRSAAADPVTALANLSSGLPLPRFVSLRGGWINVRSGPGLQYPIVWVFRRSGLPVEVLRDYHGWREIRDVDGSTGWIYGTMLSGARTALVTPWEKSQKAAEPIALRRDRSTQADVVAFLEPGLLAEVRTCDGLWCEIEVESYRGFVPQAGLWGVYQGEPVR